MNLLPNLLTVNLADKMLASNRKVLASQTAVLKHQNDLDAQIERLRLGAEQAFKEGKASEVIDAASVLGFVYKTQEASALKAQNAAISHLPQDRIFTTSAIKDVCLSYGLRFLPTALYKGALDDQIPAKLEEFKTLNGGKMPDALKSVEVGGWTGHKDYSFFIAAPSASFVLSPRPKDPLLFVFLGSDRWYLIHKWGDDLNVGAWIKQKLFHAPIILFSLFIMMVGFFEAFAQRIEPDHYQTLLGICAGISSVAFVVVGMMAAHWEEKGKQLFDHVTKDSWNSPFLG